MSKEKAKDILDFIIKRSNIYQDNNISINIHGGEPLLNYDVLRYIVENIRLWNRNVFINMTTNAVLFNEENIDFILENIDEISEMLSIKKWERQKKKNSPGQTKRKIQRNEDCR